MSVVLNESGDEYLVSSRKGVMFHVAFRLAVTPLGADATRSMFGSSSSSSDKTIKLLIVCIYMYVYI